MFRITLSYQGPLGLPVYWKDEISGVLPAAINAFIQHGLETEKGEPTADQVILLKKYFIYHVKAPCWRENAKRGKNEGELDALILKIELAETLEDLHNWIGQCLEMGLDPI